MSKSPKYYVVWRGVEPGIYTTWADCQRQVHGFPGASFKSYATEAEAREAFAAPPAEAPASVCPSSAAPSAASSSRPSLSVSRPPVSPPDYRHDTVLPLPPEVTAQAWAVDAACSGNPGPMEYRGVDLATGAVVFHYGPVHGTNNIGEFLAIVHAFALLRQQGRVLTIYTDSRNAMMWVRARKCRTKLTRDARTEKLYQLIERAEHWLQTNDWSDIPLLKWETSRWGEVPADFGRK